MDLLPLLILTLLAANPNLVIASDTTAQKAAYTAAKQQADSRYAADRKLCADEPNSSARMQCLRDAKAEYDKALADAKKQSAAEGKPKTAAAACADCGQVVSVTTATKEGKGGALGIIGGGVAGALLGSQIGSGRGRDVATIAGAAGGAYAGHKVEEKMKSTKVWSVKIKMDAGGERTIEFGQDPGLASGDLVKVSGNTVARR